LRGGADLIKAAVYIDPFKGWVLSHAFPDVALDQLALYCPLLRLLSVLKSYGESVYEHETGDVFGIGARIKPSN
jgi:hypothetical protein